MTPNDLFLSWMLWLCVGFLIGFNHHVLKVRQIQAQRIERMLRDCALDRLLTDVALRCIEHPTDARCN